MDKSGWPRCEACKFWLTGFADHGKCAHPRLFDANAEHLDGAIDGEAYSGIYTGPEFGCVHHEDKFPG